MFELRPTPFDHPDAVRLIAAAQALYRELYGGEDRTPTDPADFAAPAGFFVVGYAVAGVRAVPVACGGWRARDAQPDLRVGDAEIKRMYVDPARRGRGHARAVLAELERTAAAAGRRRDVLETGTRQPEAIKLYLSQGYRPIAPFGIYRDAPGSRCFAKPLGAASGSPADQAAARLHRDAARRARGVEAASAEGR